MALERIASTAASLLQRPSDPAQIRGGESFTGTITRILEEANQEQVSAARTINELVVDGQGTIHDAMIAVNKADSSFRLLMEMRNRVIEGVNALLETKV
jgi:flagellar hook-basal body complex protein FliE